VTNADPETLGELSARYGLECGDDDRPPGIHTATGGIVVSRPQAAGRRTRRSAAQTVARWRRRR
jgi:hypothetical protein